MFGLNIGYALGSTWVRTSLVALPLDGGVLLAVGGGAGG